MVLSRIEDGSDWQELRKRLELQQIKVRHAPHQKEAAANEVLFGFGHGDGAGICLNRKTKGMESVSMLVAMADETTVAEWKSRIKNPSEMIVVLEDLSPDTCLAFLLFYGKLAGWDRELVPDSFLDYVNRWERGDTKTTGAPNQSWGCLHSALSHVYFMEDAASAIRAGFSNCVLFVTELLQLRMEPDQVDASKGELGARALTFLAREYQAYQQSLNHAHCLQLSVPIANSAIEMQVDVYLSMEDSPLGAAKAFLRSDREHTFFGSGFSVMGVYRPDRLGTGDDMVISIDPTSGLTLQALWERLEELENAKWLGDRPCDAPRFPEVSRANQPWYHEMGKYGLIAAPKMEKGQAGSKLGWNDVTDTIWELYHPAKSIAVRPYLLAEDRSFLRLGEAGKVYDCAPIIEQSGKQMLAMKWSPALRQQSLLMTPTLKRLFAACIGRDRHAGGLPKLSELPTASAFEVMEVAGGIAVLHDDGVLLFDDWQDEVMRLEPLIQQFRHVLTRCNEVARLKKLVESETRKVRDLFERKKPLKSKWLIQNSAVLAEIKLDIHKATVETMSANLNMSETEFRHKLEARWGVGTQLEELYTSVSQLEEIMRGLSELRTNHLISGLTIYGFPFALSVGFFGFIFEGGIDFAGMAGFLAVSALILCIVLIADRSSTGKRS